MSSDQSPNVTREQVEAPTPMDMDDVGANTQESTQDPEDDAPIGAGFRSPSAGTTVNATSARQSPSGGALDMAALGEFDDPTFAWKFKEQRHKVRALQSECSTTRQGGAKLPPIEVKLRKAERHLALLKANPGHCDDSEMKEAADDVSDLKAKHTKVKKVADELDRLEAELHEAERLLALFTEECGIREGLEMADAVKEVSVLGPDGKPLRRSGRDPQFKIPDRTDPVWGEESKREEDAGLLGDMDIAALHSIYDSLIPKGDKDKTGGVYHRMKTALEAATHAQRKLEKLLLKCTNPEEKAETAKELEEAQRSLAAATSRFNEYALKEKELREPVRGMVENLLQLLDRLMDIEVGKANKINASIANKIEEYTETWTAVDKLIQAYRRKGSGVTDEQKEFLRDLIKRRDVNSVRVQRLVNTPLTRCECARALLKRSDLEMATIMHGLEASERSVVKILDGVIANPNGEFQSALAKIRKRAWWDDTYDMVKHACTMYLGTARVDRLNVIRDRSLEICELIAKVRTIGMQLRKPPCDVYSNYTISSVIGDLPVEFDTVQNVWQSEDDDSSSYSSSCSSFCSSSNEEGDEEEGEEYGSDSTGVLSASEESLSDSSSDERDLGSDDDGDDGDDDEVDEEGTPVKQNKAPHKSDGQPASKKPRLDGSPAPQPGPPRPKAPRPEGQQNKKPRLDGSPAPQLGPPRPKAPRPEGQHDKKPRLDGSPKLHKAPPLGGSASLKPVANATQPNAPKLHKAPPLGGSASLKPVANSTQARPATSNEAQRLPSALRFMQMRRNQEAAKPEAPKASKPVALPAPKKPDVDCLIAELFPKPK
jgi:hypothetical protein